MTSLTEERKTSKLTHWYVLCFFHRSVSMDDGVGHHVLTVIISLSVTDAIKRWEVAGKTLLAGGVAGAVSRTVVAPFERLKIIFQTQGQPPIYTGVVQALQKIGREEGVRGYFKGNGVNCVRIFPTSALQFYCYETYKRVRKLQEARKMNFLVFFLLFG